MGKNLVRNSNGAAHLGNLKIGFYQLTKNWDPSAYPSLSQDPICPICRGPICLEPFWSSFGVESFETKMQRISLFWCDGEVKPAVQVCKALDDAQVSVAQRLRSTQGLRIHFWSQHTGSVRTKSLTVHFRSEALPNLILCLICTNQIVTQCIWF